MWLVTTFLLMAVTQTHADYPALQAVLSQKGLQKGTTFHRIANIDKKRNKTETK